MNLEVKRDKQIHPNENRSAKKREKHRKSNTKRTVVVNVDGDRKRVKSGTYIVSDFKELVDVAADRELDILRDGSFEPLDDDAKIKIRGREVFISHVRTGASS